MTVAGAARIVGAQAGAPPGEVQRFVSVLDDDRPVLGLTIEDFIVEEDGQRREILRVDPASVPLDVAILVDAGMAAQRNIGHIRQALTTLVRSLAGHDVALYAFANQRRTVVPFTRSTEQLIRETSTFAGFAESSTYLLEAMLETAADLQRRAPQRPAMIVLTGQDRGTDDLAVRGLALNNNRLTPDAARDRSADDVVNALRDAGVVVNTVATQTLDVTANFRDFRSSGLTSITSGTGSFRWMQENRERERVIDQAPSETGGRLYKVSSTQGIEERMVRIADELTNQYLLTYARPDELVPPDDDEIEVDTVEDDYTVRSLPSLVYIPYVAPTVYVLDGTVVEPDMVYHHSPDCPGFGGLGGQNAVSVPLDALGSNGRFCPYCPERPPSE